MLKKVLQIGADNFGRGGRSIVAYNLIKNMDTNIQNDFLATSHYIESDITRSIKKNGYIHVITNNLFYNLTLLIKRENYDIVHIHVDQAYEGLKLVLAVKFGGCKKIILHGHSSGDIVNYSLIQKLCINISKQIVKSLNLIRIAVSRDAGDYLFGEDSKNIIILKDGIDSEKYRFDDDSRNRVRAVQKFSGKFCIGTVGRLSSEKNQLFLVDIFSKYLQFNKNAILFLVGDGEEKMKLEQEVVALGLKDKVFFYGYSSNIPSILSSFDVFVFPSVHEGFGMAALEAQANGLPTLISIGVPNEVIVTPNCQKIYSWDPQKWANSIKNINCKLKKRERFSDRNIKYIKKLGYDIDNSSKKLETIYKSKE